MKLVRAQQPDDQSEDCYATGAEDGDYRTWLSLSLKGLVVRTDFARHLSAGCQAEAVIPYAELARYRGKNSAYRFGPD